MSLIMSNAIYQNDQHQTRTSETNKQMKLSMKRLLSDHQALNQADAAR